MASLGDVVRELVSAGVPSEIIDLIATDMADAAAYRKRDEESRAIAAAKAIARTRAACERQRRCRERKRAELRVGPKIDRKAPETVTRDKRDALSPLDGFPSKIKSNSPSCNPPTLQDSDDDDSASARIFDELDPMISLLTEEACRAGGVPNEGLSQPAKNAATVWGWLAVGGTGPTILGAIRQRRVEAGRISVSVLKYYDQAVRAAVSLSEAERLGYRKDELSEVRNPLRRAALGRIREASSHRSYAGEEADIAF